MMVNCQKKLEVGGWVVVLPGLALSGTVGGVEERWAAEVFGELRGCGGGSGREAQMKREERGAKREKKRALLLCGWAFFSFFFFFFGVCCVLGFFVRV
jgi:hypothetical protein